MATFRLTTAANGKVFSATFYTSHISKFYLAMKKDSIDWTSRKETSSNKCSVLIDVSYTVYSTNEFNKCVQYSQHHITPAKCRLNNRKNLVIQTNYRSCAARIKMHNTEHGKLKVN